MTVKAAIKTLRKSETSDEDIAGGVIKMKEIKCPKCGEVFSVDVSDYNAIVKQVRDESFKQVLNERIKSELNSKVNEFELQKKKY